VYVPGLSVCCSLHGLTFFSGRSCGDCPRNASDCFRKFCVTADGFQRGLLTANRQMPGPVIQVRRQSLTDTCAQKTICENLFPLVGMWAKIYLQNSNAMTESCCVHHSGVLLAVLAVTQTIFGALWFIPHYMFRLRNGHRYVQHIKTL
jgi:hypothetical protein